MRRLGLDTVDLYLIHWPVPRGGPIRRDLKALEKLAADGRVRAIGVSNFNAEPALTAFLCIQRGYR